VIFHFRNKSDIFRGAFGNIANKVSEKSGSSLYKNIFKPEPLTFGPAGMRERPRPFVIIPPDDNRSSYKKDDLFELGINVFGSYCEMAACFVDIVNQMGDYGIGSNLAKFSVVKVYDGKPLSYSEITGTKILIDFVTPTLIKENGRILKEITFPAVFKRLRDRLNAISLFYEGEALNYDNFGLGKLSESVGTLSSKWESHYFSRTASSGEKQSIGGITGFGVYDFSSSEKINIFLPWLFAGTSVNVGKNTLWGNGRFILNGMR